MSKVTKATQLRPAVLAFAYQMEERLRKHDKKRGEDGWTSCGVDDLFLHLAEEIGEVSKMLRSDQPIDDRLGGECADVGNMAMMIADVEGELDIDRANEDLSYLIHLEEQENARC